jgi:hypothetical protein
MEALGEMKPLLKAMAAVFVSLAVLMLFGQLNSVRPQTSSVGEQSNATFIGVAREALLTHQNQTGLDSTVMISMLDMISHVDTGYQKWNSTYGNFDLRMEYYVPDPNNSGGMPIMAILLWETQNGIPWVQMYVDNGVVDRPIQDFRDSFNASNTQISVTKEQAESTATEYIKNYSYTAQSGITVSGFNISPNSTTANLLNNTRDRLLCPCWTVIFTLNQTYPDGVSQLFVEVWADTGEIFAVGNLAPTHLITIDNPYPTPTPTPTSTPSTSPSPSQSASPSPSASSSPSNSPSQTPNPTATPNPTNNPSPSQTLPNSQEPMSSPTQNQPIPPETLYAIAIAAAIIAVAAVAFVLRKRSAKQETTQLSGASE